MSADYPSYKQLVARAAETDPLYQKHAGRVHITEPNGMTVMFKRKDKNVLGK